MLPASATTGIAGIRARPARRRFPDHPDVGAEYKVPQKRRQKCLCNSGVLQEPVSASASVRIADLRVRPSAAACALPQFTPPVSSPKTLHDGFNDAIGREILHAPVCVRALA